MPHTFLFVGLLPILVFGIIDAFSKNIRVSVTATVLTSFGELILVYHLTGAFDPVSLTGTALFILLGLYSLRTQNRLWIKLQPAVVTLLIAFIMGYLQFFGTPIIERYWKLIEQALTPEQIQMVQEEGMRQILNQAFNWFIAVLVLDAAWIAYSAKRQSQRAWVLVNVFGLFVLLFVVGIVAAISLVVTA